jgi:putative membrane protein insertion efficiency factor
MNATGSDLNVRNASQVPLVRALLGLITGYRRWISPFLPPACRFHPTCSDYAADAIRVHGAGRGTVLAVRRVCRCHPLNAGGFDPVPPRGEVRREPAPVSSLVLNEVPVRKVQ